MKFTFGAEVLNFEIGGSYAASRPYSVGQVTDRTAGGSLQVETLGHVIHGREILFRGMGQTDYDNLKNWILNVCVGARNVFEFEDEKGYAADVRMISGIVDIVEVAHEVYEGSIILEYV